MHLGISASHYTQLDGCFIIESLSWFENPLVSHYGKDEAEF